jgi:hypothetical protein
VSGVTSAAAWTSALPLTGETWVDVIARMCRCARHPARERRGVPKVRRSVLEHLTRPTLGPTIRSHSEPSSMNSFPEPRRDYQAVQDAGEHEIDSTALQPVVKVRRCTEGGEAPR